MIDVSWSLRKAASYFMQIPYTTDSKDKEKAFIKAATTCGKWDQPLTLVDVRQLAKSFLDSRRCNIFQFNNMPSKDWTDSLLSRHSNNVTSKLAANIKRPRQKFLSMILTI